MDIDRIGIRHLDLTEHEKSLLNSKDLLAVIIANVSHEGYYINKAGKKTYVILDEMNDNVYVCCTKEEDDVQYIESTTFVDGLPDDAFERDHTLLPMDCVGHCNFAWMIPIKLVRYTDDENGIFFEIYWKGARYANHLNDEFVKEIEEIRFNEKMKSVIIGEILINFFENETYKTLEVRE